MKPYMLCAFLIVASSALAQAQVKENLKTYPTPKENSSVTKKYDENGNLIQYDSVYTFSYSNFNPDSSELESIFQTFPKFFNQNMDEFLGSDFIRPDSVFFNNFFNGNFFEQGFINQDEDLLKLMQRMDSIKNEFFIDPTY